MEVLFLTGILVIFFLYAKSLISRQSNAKPPPPGPTGLPILGSLLQLGRFPHRSLAKLADRHGPLMTLRLGSVATVIASSPEVAGEIFRRHDETFADRHVPDVITAQPNPEATLAWVPGDHRWRNRRRFCSTQMFAAQRLDSSERLRREKVQQLVAHLRKHAFSGGGAAVDVGRAAFGTTLNLMSNTIFSVDLVVGSDYFESAQEFKDLVWRIMEDAGRLNLSDYFPVLRRFDLQGVKRHIRASYDRLHEIFDELIDKRLEERGSGGSRTGDFLDLLLDQCQEEGSDFNRITIKPLILDLFIAGSDTSAITTEWAMAELLRQPDVRRKAREELSQVIGPGRAVQESDIDQLPYLQAIVKETLRLHPAVPLLLPYKARNDVELCGYAVAKGTQVLINAWAIGRDPKYWTEPTCFMPERFLLKPSVDYRGRDFEYIPFGAGRRICPGLPLAARMVHLMLASILHPFDWKLPEGISPEELDMEEQFGVTLKKAVPLCAIPVLDKDLRA
ncbi:Cytochrome P450, E-class, group I [Parasponia andersonii]|uniref:Cytochrome P450, E-class, group I n=1 Tax=Parasponia andersonii TaxID=3476 RepID=A0A2P5CQR9_PARAD|nr:Cytochrome P450, E-class, group I [Parasponia andersonii]